MEWWERLRAKWLESGLSIDALHELTDIPGSTIYKYVTGQTKNPGGDRLELLAKELNTTKTYILVGDLPLPTVETKVVPLLSLDSVSAFTDGKILMSEIIADKTIIVSVDKPEDCFCVTCEDGANSPNIRPGDVIVFDVQAPLEPGRLVLVSSPKDNASYIGRYKPLSSKDKAKFVVRFENDDFPPVENSKSSPLHILARAVKVLRDID